MKTRLLSCVTLMGIMLTGCFTVTSGNINNGKDTDATVKKEIKAPYFNEVKASQGIKVIVSQGEYPGKISVATTPSAEQYLQVKVTDGKLKAYYDNNKLKGSIKGPSIITVTLPDLEETELSSGASLVLKGAFSSTQKMEFDLSSGSSLNIENLSCPNLSIDTSSGASATVSYIKGNVDADASSGSSISVVAAEGGVLEFEASSGADIDANSVNSTAIKASASSGGSISLSGKTKSLNKNTSSGGTVRTTKLIFPQ